MWVMALPDYLWFLIGGFGNYNRGFWVEGRILSNIRNGVVRHYLGNKDRQEVGGTKNRTEK